MGVRGWSARSPGAATCTQGRRSQARARQAGFSRGLPPFALGTSGILLVLRPTLLMTDKRICKLRQNPATVLGAARSPYRQPKSPGFKGKKNIKK